jgi:hypothetical protein
MRVASKNLVEEDKCIELNKENIPKNKKTRKFVFEINISKEFDTTQFESNEYRIFLFLIINITPPKICIIHAVHYSSEILFIGLEDLINGS